MSYAKVITTNMTRSGHKTSRWTTRAEAKVSARKRRRAEDRKEVARARRAEG